jgi:hypothetical protein
MIRKEQSGKSVIAVNKFFGEFIFRNNDILNNSISRHLCTVICFQGLVLPAFDNNDGFEIAILDQCTFNKNNLL